ncbi:MAG TPA: DUF1990 domain-containing protein [Actinoplanes sp.]
MPRDMRAVVAELADAPLTYPEVGATRDGALPAGYGHLHREAFLGTGRAVFERAAAGLLAWRMHERAGIPVTRSVPTAVTGAVVVQRPGIGPLRLTVPCRVVYTVAESDRQGFGYGTLAGHPERGEESFVVTLAPSGEVRAVIRAFSRPATLLSQAGGPMTGLVQRYVTGRYLAALQNIARSDAV